MNEAMPVKNATAIKRSAPRGFVVPRSGGRGAGRASTQTTAAITRFSMPAMRSVPGRPYWARSTNALASTPAAAPRLLVK